MTRLTIVLLAFSATAFGEAPSMGASPLPQLLTELIQEVRQLRAAIDRQQAALAILESMRLKSGRAAVLESRLEQVEEDLSVERRRANEMQNLAGAASEADRPVLIEQHRRASEAVIELESKRSRLQSEIANAAAEQDSLLKRIAAR